MIQSRQLSQARYSGINRGFADFMAQVYRYMTGGLLLSALSAWVCAREPVLHYMYAVNQNGILAPTILAWIIVFAPLFILFPLNNAVRTNTPGSAQIWFWIFSALMGAGFSNIFLFFQQDIIFKAFLITGAMFGSCSLWGHNTKKELGVIGRFCSLAVIGIIIASVINIFVQSSMTSFVIDVVCVFAFAGLTAYDTQKLKRIYASLGNQGQEMLASYSVMGAVTLYLDFINMFMAILRLLDSRRR